MTELEENAPVYSFFPWIKNCKISKNCVIQFGFRKGKTENFIFPSSELYLVFWWIYSILGTEKYLYSCIGDCDWRKRRLPLLDRVLLSLVEVRLKWVSWVVRYLDKPQRRAVKGGAMVMACLSGKGHGKYLVAQ